MVPWHSALWHSSEWQSGDSTKSSRIGNVWLMDRFQSKLVSFIFLVTNTPVLTKTFAYFSVHALQNYNVFIAQAAKRTWRFYCLFLLSRYAHCSGACHHNECHLEKVFKWWMSWRPKNGLGWNFLSCPTSVVFDQNKLKT